MSGSGPDAPPVDPSRHTCQLLAVQGIGFADVYRAFVTTYGADTIRCIQYRPHHVFDLVTATSDVRTHVLETGFLDIGGVRCEVVSAGAHVRRLVLRGVPFFTDEAAITAALAPYGSVLGMDFEAFEEFPGCTNGNRRVRMVMKSKVPNFLDLGGRRVVVSYAGVVPLCFRCSRPGHVVASCPGSSGRRRSDSVAVPTSGDQVSDPAEVPASVPDVMDVQDSAFPPLPVLADSVVAVVPAAPAVVLADPLTGGPKEFLPGDVSPPSSPKSYASAASGERSPPPSPRLSSSSVFPPPRPLLPASRLPKRVRSLSPPPKGAG